MNRLCTTEIPSYSSPSEPLTAPSWPGRTELLHTRQGAIALLPGGGDIGRPIRRQVVSGAAAGAGQVERRENVVIIRANAQYEEVFESEFGTAFDGMTEIPIGFMRGTRPIPTFVFGWPT